jgi:hypothetical protein
MDLLGPRRLFTAKGSDADMYDAAHLAEMIATLVPRHWSFCGGTPRGQLAFGARKVRSPVDTWASLKKLTHTQGTG